MSPRIYATPSVILRTSGSVGVALLMWLLGALIAAAGTTVYIELGTVCLSSVIVGHNAHRLIQGLPRSGGEKNYLEYIYRRPKFLTTCAFSIYAVITVCRMPAQSNRTPHFILPVRVPPPPTA